MSTSLPKIVWACNCDSDRLRLSKFENKGNKAVALHELLSINKHAAYRFLEEVSPHVMKCEAKESARVSLTIFITLSSGIDAITSVALE